MKNVHVCFLLSVSLVAASLQLLIYTESAVCEAASEGGWNPNSSTPGCSFGYRNVPWAAPSLCSKCSDSCNFLDLLCNSSMFVDLSTLLIKYFSCLISPKNMNEIIKTCMQFVAHIVGYFNLLLSQVMHSKQSCGKWTTHPRTTPQIHVPGIRKWSIALLDPSSLACEFSISFYTMFNANSLNLCTRRLTRWRNPSHS